jgi:hypothetical protein
MFHVLGCTFRARVVQGRKRNTLFVNFTPAVTSKPVTSMLIMEISRPGRPDHWQNRKVIPQGYGLEVGCGSQGPSEHRASAPLLQMKLPDLPHFSIGLNIA